MEVHQVGCGMRVGMQSEIWKVIPEKANGIKQKA